MAKKDRLLLVGMLLLACVLTVVCVFTGHPLAGNDATAAANVEQMAAVAEQALKEDTCRQIALSDGGSKALCPDVGIEGNQVTVTGPGIYHVSGNLGTGCLTVRADGNVTLILDGVTIDGGDGPALDVDNAKRTLLYLAEGSENTLTSGTVRSETAEKTEETSGAAVYARDPLYVAGKGTLTVDGQINNGISTTDDLVILDGTLNVTAANNGLRGKDSLTVLGGKVTVVAGNTEDLTENLSSTALSPEMNGMPGVPGEIGQRPENMPEPPEMGSMPGAPGEMGQRPDDMPKPPKMGGMPENGKGQPPTETENVDRQWDRGQEDNRFGNMGGGRWGGFGGDPRDNASQTESDSGGKGLKTDGELEIRGGTVTVVSADDALHAGVSVTVCGGSVTLTAGDDGIHGDERVTVTGGDIRVLRSNEGIEAHEIDITGGTLSVVASDDGMNANGGPDMFAWNRTETTGETTLASLTIRGGDVYVRADGDGLDSNGNLILLGGHVIVDGPTNGGNGALDSGSENGGEMRVEGGTLLAIGSSGMAETFGETSTQCSFIETLSKTYPADTKVIVRALDGTVLVEHTSATSFDSVVFTDPALKVGESCELTVGDDTLTVSIDAITNGEGSGFGMPSFGGFGRR